MASFVKFHCFVEDLAEKVHNLGSDTIKAMLTNTAPVAGNTVKTDITEISAGNGYAAGGVTLTLVSSAQSGGTHKLVLADGTITASGGAIGPWRYVVLYNDTAAGKELIGWLDYGSSVSLNAGETLTIDCNAATGVLTIA